MTDATIGYGKDTWAGSGKPAANHNGATRLRLMSGSAYTFLYLKTPVPDGRTVVSATLQVYAARTADWTGSKTLTARRVSDDWLAGKLTWNNKPGVTGSSQPTATASSAVDGQLLTFDVTVHLQTIANGSSHYGWRIESNSSTAHRIYGFDSDYPPKLLVTYSDEPAQPTDLVPQGIISLSKPYVTFSATDLSKDGDLAAIQVQVDPAANATTPAFDSGWLTQSTPELNLATTAYAGLADGSSTQWRARVQNSAGAAGDWSDWVTISRDSKGTLAINNPAAASPFVTEATPPILWALTGETQTAWQVRITDQADRSNILHDSGKNAGTDTSYTLPKKILHDDGAYSVLVRVWDGKDRAASPGDPRYTQAWQDFVMDDDITVTSATGLTAAQDGGTPWVVLTWTRATAPDSWTILRDGKVVDADVDPADTVVSGTTHSWRDPAASPRAQHTYNVRAVVNGKASPKSSNATATVNPQGIWLLDTDKNQAAVIYGTDAGTWAMPDQAATYSVIGGTRTVRIVSGMHGLEGNVTGQLVDVTGGMAATDAKAALMGYKEHPEREFQLVLSDTSIPVRIGNVSVYPTPNPGGDSAVMGVSFDFWQSDDLAFDAVL